MKKSDDGGPKLRRDENNQLDVDHADSVVHDLTRKLITEERYHQKDNAMKHTIGDRRDVVVKTIIYHRNTVNGHLVQEDRKNPLYEKLSADPLDPYLYRYFEHIDGEILAREQPMAMATIGRWTMGMFKACVNYLARMNVIDRI